MKKNIGAMLTALLGDNASRERKAKSALTAHKSDSAAHTGVDELIDYVVVGYAVTTEEPSDWSTNWADYYTKSGNIEDGYTYTALADETAPTWTADTYFSKGEVELTEMTEEPDGTPYNFKSVYISTEFTDDGDTDAVYISAFDTANCVLGISYAPATYTDYEGAQWLKVFLNRGYWEHCFSYVCVEGTYGFVYNFWKYNHKYTEVECETISKIQIRGALPGVVVKIYGVRA